MILTHDEQQNNLIVIFPRIMMLHRETFISLPEIPLCLTSHPHQPLLVAGYETGKLTCSSLTSDLKPPARTDLIGTCNSACRAVHHISESHLAAGSANGSVHTFDCETARSIATIPLFDAATTTEGGVLAVSALCAMSESCVVVGDDEGGLHLCDIRMKTVAAKVLEQGDYVSALQTVNMYGTNAVLASSGDGTLCAYDVRIQPCGKVKLMYAFDSFNDDLTSICIQPDIGLVVAATLSGALQLYDARFLDTSCDHESVGHVERFIGHPECVSAVLPLPERNLVCTASCDGFLRVVDVLAKSLEDALPYADKEQDADDADAVLWPIESMVSMTGLPYPTFALQSHDEKVRFCTYREEAENETKNVRSRPKQGGTKKTRAGKRKRKDTGEEDKSFFDNL